MFERTLTISAMTVAAAMTGGGATLEFRDDVRTSKDDACLDGYLVALDIQL